VTEYAFINGELMPASAASLNINDLALLRGYGVFDFFRVIDGRPIFLEDYLDRFENSLKGLGLTTSYSRAYLTDHIYKLIRLNPHPLLGVKMVCTGGYAHDGYTPGLSNLFMLARPFAFHPYEHGLKLMTVNHQRELYHVKSINYLTPISLLPKMKAINADDVLYVNDKNITESSRSNIFIIKRGVLITPDHGMLLGITRKRIIGFANEIMPVEVRQVSLEEVYAADEVFLTASTKRISPVVGIDDETYQSGPYTRLLFERLLEEESKF
jgi:branched-chain amino acid aminotransferase